MPQDYQAEYYEDFEIPTASQGPDLALDWARFEDPDMLNQPFTA